jgi:hypothetical protein
VLSFLTSAKSFSGPAGANQLRALKSWLAISPEAEVILYGYSEGADEVCDDLGIRYVPNIRSTSKGVPYFDAIADHAREHARHDIQIYSNCDILLTDSLLNAINRVTFKKYLIIGQRLDLSQNANFEIDRSDWMDQLVNLKENGMISLHPTSGKDYFVFPRGLWEAIPSLIIGRLGYDDGLLAFCLERDIPIVDATCDVVSIHQYHDYIHLPGGLAELIHGSDSKHNITALGSMHSTPLVSDAKWTLRFGKLEKTYAHRDYLRYAELFVRFRMGWVMPSYALRAVWRLLTTFRFFHIDTFNIEEVLKGYAMTMTNADSSPRV